MPQVRSKREVQDFRDRWSAQIFAFCRVFLGNQERAQESTVEAFLVYLRQGLAPDETRLPNLLLQCAVEAVRDKCSCRDPRTARAENLESAILSLPCDQRIVFILRSVLRMDSVSVTVATGLAREQVRELWVSSLLRIRELLPEDFFKEHAR